MSSTTSQKLPSEASPTLPTFSYAQAAKGRSPSVPSLLSSGQISSETMNATASSTSLPNTKDAAAVPVNGSAVEPSSEVHEKGDVKDGDHPNDLEGTPKNTTSLLQSSTLPQPQPATSTPSSPSFETASTSTLPKEDELSSTANGSLDSNWDKNSQSSQNGSKPSEKVEENKAQNSAAVWNDEGPTSALLKEAPPPAVNIWQHRKEIHEARAKSKQVTGPQAPKLTTQFGASGSMNNPLKNPESGADLKKHENRKKVKSGSAYVEEKSSLGSNKEGNRPSEARTKGLEEGELLIVHLDRPLLTTDTQKKPPIEVPERQIPKSLRPPWLLLHRLPGMQYLGLRRTVPKTKKKRERKSEPKRERRKKLRQPSHMEKKNGCPFLMSLQLYSALLYLQLEEAAERRVVAEMAGSVLEALLKATMARRRQAVLQGATQVQLW